MVEDEYQPQGLLVRLHDDTMGHATRLLARRGPAAAAAAAAYARSLRGDGAQGEGLWGGRGGGRGDGRGGDGRGSGRGKSAQREAAGDVADASSAVPDHAPEEGEDCGGGDDAATKGGDSLQSQWLQLEERCVISSPR